MNKSVFASSMALMMLASPVQAADLDRELGLIVSGVVDKWTGVQVVNNEGSGRDFSVLASGAAGYLSLPLGSNLSIQNDFKIEYNSNAFNNDVMEFGPKYGFQGAAHLSYRDPNSYLFGIFGGAGSISHNDFLSFEGDIGYDYRFIGGEAQIYVSDVTVYGQVGFVDISEFDPVGNPDEAIFGRGVVRWFLGDDQRLQFDGVYVNVKNWIGDFGDIATSIDNYDVLAWGVRYDHDFEVPVLGKVPLYLSYRGVAKLKCSMGQNQSEHTFMIGTSYSFSGSRIDIDRNGATLDTADFGNYFTCLNYRELQDG